MKKSAKILFLTIVVYERRVWTYIFKLRFKKFCIQKSIGKSGKQCTIQFWILNTKKQSNWNQTRILKKKHTKFVQTIQQVF